MTPASRRRCSGRSRGEAAASRPLAKSENFPLLSDPGYGVADRFGVWGVRKNGSEGILRTTFVIDQGKIARVLTDVQPTGHAREVLEALSKLPPTAPAP